MKFSSIACLILSLPFFGIAAAALAEQPNANARSYATQSNPETLVLDARDAGRGLSRGSGDLGQAAGGTDG